MQRDVVIEYPFKNELKVPVAFFEQRKKMKSNTKPATPVHEAVFDELQKWANEKELVKLDEENSQ